MAQQVREQFMAAFEKNGKVIGFSANNEYVVRIMRIKETELRIIQLPLVRPFRTSFGTQTSA